MVLTAYGPLATSHESTLIHYISGEVKCQFGPYFPPLGAREWRSE